MARLPKLRKKNGYWMTKAGGTETYFGKVAILPYADARRLFLDHLKAVADHKKQVHPTKAYFASWAARILSLKNSLSR